MMQEGNRRSYSLHLEKYAIEVMIEDAGGYKMHDFDKFVEQQQIEWRSKHITIREYGTQNGKQRVWILPKHLWELGLWQGIGRDSDNSLVNYLERTDVLKHDGVHNLKSSWMLCSNLYFAF